MGQSIYQERDTSLFIQPRTVRDRDMGLVAPQSALYQTMAIGYDGSHYTLVDWDILAPVIDFFIWKCSEGDDYQDETFPGACQSAYDRDRPFAAYHFFRIDQYLGLPFPSDQSVIDKYWPTPAQDSQLQNMIHTLTNKSVDGLYIDVEATKELATGKLINPLWASKVAKMFMGRACDWWYKTHPIKPFGMYTSNGYINANAPDMVNWAGDYDNWVAQWAVYPQNAVTVDWATAKANYMPQDTSKPKPFGNGTAKLWQYTGDRLILPGVYTNDGKRQPRTCDLDVFMGSKDAMLSYFNYKPHGTTPPADDKPPVSDSDTTRRIEAIEAEIAAIKTALRKPIMD